LRAPDTKSRGDTACRVRQDRVWSVVNVEWKSGDHDTRRAGLEHRLKQPAALVVQDLVAALARDDLGDQDRDRRVLRLNRLDVPEHGAYKRTAGVEQHL